MCCQWLKTSSSLNSGIKIINSLEDTKSQQLFYRIVEKLKQHDSEMFTDEETHKLEKIFKITENDLVLCIKTIIYLFKRMLKYVFMPSDLKRDLTEVGLSNGKADSFVKAWSTQTSTTLNEIGTEVINIHNNNLKFSSKLNAELSSDINKKCKVPKAYVSICDKQKVTDIELNHTELYSMFLQFESIQHELDYLM